MDEFPPRNDAAPMLDSGSGEGGNGRSLDVASGVDAGDAWDVVDRTDAGVRADSRSLDSAIDVPQPMSIDAPLLDEVGSTPLPDAAGPAANLGDAGCLGEVCGTQCTPPEGYCAGTTPTVCDPTGQWVTSPIDAGVCGAECTPGRGSCSGTTPKTCDSTGHWVSSSIVAGICAAECTPGIDPPRCTEKTPQTCGTDGKWQNQTECPSLCSNGSCTGVCGPGTSDCLDGRKRTCDSAGAWLSSAVIAGTCGAACTPGTSRPKCSTDYRQICGADGQWTNESVCPNGCQGEGLCNKCRPGSRQCSGTLLQTCNSDGSTWSAGQLTVGECGVKCLPSEPIADAPCAGTVPQICNSTGTARVAGTITPGLCDAVCAPGGPYSPAPCSSTTPQLCNSTGSGAVAGQVAAGVCGAECTPATPMPTAPCGVCGGTKSCQANGLYGTCNDPPKGTYYRDADGDGYGNPATTTTACSLPSGYVTNNADCCDSDVNARPGQTSFFTVKNACGSWDYNCDSVGETQPSNTCCFCTDCSSARTGQCATTACGGSRRIETTCSGSTYCSCGYDEQGGRSVTQACR